LCKVFAGVYHRLMPKRWNDADRQAFRDGQRLRAHTIPGRRHLAPEVMEWDETPDGDQDGTIEFDADLAFELLEDR
jgi:hypothetical protein